MDPNIVPEKVVGSLLEGPQKKVPPDFRKLPHGGCGSDCRSRRLNLGFGVA